METTGVADSERDGCEASRPFNVPPNISVNNLRDILWWKHNGIHVYFQTTNKTFPSELHAYKATAGWLILTDTKQRLLLYQPGEHFVGHHFLELLNQGYNIHDAFSICCLCQAL